MADLHQTPGALQRLTTLWTWLILTCFLSIIVLPPWRNTAVAAFKLSLRAKLALRCNDSPAFCLPMAAKPIVTTLKPTSVTLNWTYGEESSLQMPNRGSVLTLRLRLREMGGRAYLGWTTKGTLAGRLQQHTLRDLVPGRTYRLRIVTFNAMGSVTSRTVTFQTKEDLQLKCTPKQEAVRIGGNAEFRCRASGGPDLSMSTSLSAQRSSVEQRREGNRRELIIRFQNIQLNQDESSYCVQATTRNLRKKRCFQILIQEPVRIRCAKSNRCGRHGRTNSRLTVRCTVEGHPMPNITWYFNGEAVNNTVDRSGWRVLARRHLRPNSQGVASFQHRLRADRTRQELHTGQVRIHAHNAHSQAHTTQDVVITDDRRRTSISVPDSRPIQGEQVSILCNANIGQSGLKFKWFYRSSDNQRYRLLEPNSNGILYSNTSSHHSHRLLIPQANFSHAGQYKCQAINRYRCEGNATTSIRIRAPLYVSMSQSDGWTVHKFDKPAVVNCTIRSTINNRLPRVYWKLNGDFIKGSHNLRTSWRVSSGPAVNDMASSGTAVYQLRSNKLKPSDIGRVQCVADSRDGLVREESVTVIAKGAVRVYIDKRSSNRVSLGGPVHIVCQIFTDNTSLHRSMIQGAGWLRRPVGTTFRSRPKPVAHEPGVEVERKLVRSPHGSWLQLSLEISSFSYNMNGVYYCRAPMSRRQSMPQEQATVKLFASVPGYVSRSKTLEKVIIL